MNAAVRLASTREHCRRKRPQSRAVRRSWLRCRIWTTTSSAGRDARSSTKAALPGVPRGGPSATKLDEYEQRPTWDAARRAAAHLRQASSPARDSYFARTTRRHPRRRLRRILRTEGERQRRVGRKPQRHGDRALRHAAPPRRPGRSPPGSEQRRMTSACPPDSTGGPSTRRHARHADVAVRR
jgi:hypothetical protein